MVDQVIDVSHAAAIIPEIWSDNFQPTRLAMFAFESSVAQDYAGEISQLGDTVNVTLLNEFSEADLLDEGDAASAEAPTMNNLPIQVTSQATKDWILTERTIRQAIDPDMQLRNLAFHSIFKRIERSIIEAVSPSSSSPDHVAEYAAASTLALADILAAKTALDDADNPAEGRYMVARPNEFNDVYNISGFTNRDFIGDGATPLTSGAITTPLLGFSPRMTTVISDDTTYFYHRLAIQLIIQDQPSVKVFDQGVDGRRTMRTNTTALYGLRQMDNQRIYTVS